MKTTKQVATVTLVILLALIAYGLFRTGRSLTASQMALGGEPAQSVRGSAIDQSALYNARQLTQMPTSADELPLAQEALRLGDREMDLAFAAGVREAKEHPATLSVEAKESQARLQDAQNSLDRDKSRVAQLTAELAKASGARADRLDARLQEAKVQMELDQDEVDNSKQELVLAGGDAQGRIEELMKEHEAASRLADSTIVNAVTPPDVHGLVHHYEQWSQLHDKTLELRQARKDAELAAATFTTKRDRLESNFRAQKQENAGTISSLPLPSTATNSTPSTRNISAELVRATQHRSAVLKDLTNVSERIEDQKQLRETYRKWIDVLVAEQRPIIHNGLFSTAVIVLILLIAISFDSLLKRLLKKVRLDQRQADTLHAV